MILNIETWAKRAHNMTVNWFKNMAFLFLKRQTANMTDPTEDKM